MRTLQSPKLSKAGVQGCLCQCWGVLGLCWLPRKGFAVLPRGKITLSALLPEPLWRLNPKHHPEAQALPAVVLHGGIQPQVWQLKYPACNKTSRNLSFFRSWKCFAPVSHTKQGSWCFKVTISNKDSSIFLIQNGTTADGTDFKYPPPPTFPFLLHHSDFLSISAGPYLQVLGSLPTRPRAFPGASETPCKSCSQ